MAESVFIGWFGPIRFESTGSSIIFAGNVQADRFLGADGTEALPTFSFSGTGDGDNGMYLSAADTLGFSAGGTLRASLSGTALTSTVPISLANGSAAAPSLSFTNDTTDGWFRQSESNIGFALNGTGRYRVDGNFVMAGAMALAWEPTFDAGADVSLSRGAADRLTLAVGDALNLAPTAFASLPAGAEGNIACVTDSSTATWGATIAGGGANNVLAFHNGTNWTVMGA